MNSLPPISREKAGLTLTAQFLSEADYLKAIESFIIVCADILLIDSSKKVIYLAKRKTKPYPNWYLLGGRIKRGETELEAACRITKQEAGLDIEPTRFSYLTWRRFWWSEREQEPQSRGSDNIQFIFTVEVSDKERETVVLDEQEYEAQLGLKAFDRSSLTSGDTHPILRELYDKLFP